VGIGLELSTTDRKLVVSRVHAKGPAQDAGLLRNDRIVRVDKQAVGHLLPEEAALKIRGKPGTEIVLEVRRPGERENRIFKVLCRFVPVPSVEQEVLTLSEMSLVGYLRIHHFQESTLQEVKEAIATLQSASGEPLKGLILDLRGNPGGLFKSGVQVAELFTGDGVIVNSQSPFKEYNRPFKAEGVEPLALPLVVLVDNETASAAEVLAGAIKEQRSARFPTRIVGQVTYGKGSIQCVLALDKAPLDKMPGGIRLTVARLLSPSGVPYTGRGILPDVACDLEGEAAIDKAKEILLNLMKPMPMMS
jgi:carboxyl-terminal processing protease